ncbi:hypothetical protein [Phreatobacter stygius]|nr:hypothetical protein [Phreatobacter stygius]
MIVARMTLASLALLALAACATPPPPQVDETRTQRQVRDPKTELERGPRR